MKVTKGIIREIQRNEHGKYQAVISLAGGKAPKPGQYLQAHREKDRDAVIATTIFPGGISNGENSETFTTAPSIPQHWQPGDGLLLRGPLGKGFSMPNHTSRLALAALGKDCEHLLPLAGTLIGRGGEVALLTDHQHPHLPTQVEISPLSNLEEALMWADFLAVSGSPEELARLKTTLYSKRMLPCPAQALILMPMPCGALGSCGVCALTDSKGHTLLACEDGPVFEWDKLPSEI
jgi:NAD(P)H-flavin reductase